MHHRGRVSSDRTKGSYTGMHGMSPPYRDTDRDRDSDSSSDFVYDEAAEEILDEITQAVESGDHDLETDDILARLSVLPLTDGGALVDDSQRFKQPFPPLRGNIYIQYAWGITSAFSLLEQVMDVLHALFCECDCKAALRSSRESFDIAVGLLVHLLIAAIQIFAPPAIFFASVFGWGGPQTIDMTQFTLNFSIWQPRDGQTDISKYIAGYFLIALFLCYAMKTCLLECDEISGHLRIARFVNAKLYPNRSPRPVSEWMIVFSAVSTCWLAVWLALDTFIVMGVSDTVIEVLFDSLALLFLFNLDNLNGEFGFVISRIDWPEKGLGFLKDTIQHSEKLHVSTPKKARIAQMLFGCSALFLVLVLLFHLIFFFAIDWPGIAENASNRRSGN